MTKKAVKRMRWTDKQRQVIETRGCNLLVSAAAGSGKTAVLVERVIRLISEGAAPLDIDRLLVMTFTNAAAAEMRERIALAVEQKLAGEPENEHLQAQAALIPYAQIMTIDSFCLNLIRDHFNLLDIDPAFRVGDEGELILLRADVMEEMLEEYYAAGDPVFERFVETYAAGKSDSGIEDYIMQIYTFARSNPFPEQWIGRCRKELSAAEAGRLEETAWMRFLIADMRRQFEEMDRQYEAAAAVCREPDGPEVYLPTILEEQQMLKRLAAVQNYGELSEALRGVTFGRLKAVRSDQADPERKEQVSECRDRVKKALTGMAKTYGAQTEEEAAALLLQTKDVVLKLLELAEEFSRRYQEKKREKNLVDFNDLEHYALEILVKRPEEADDGREPRLQYTETADHLSRQYAEILVDEYQDSNFVQETLVMALSGERFGRPNVFMVGDVKQSIYRFRLARPELFMEKYETYRTDGGPCRKIELHQNFRSRDTVLESVNRIFYQIMTKNLGNVEYTEEAALHPGVVFEAGERTGTPVELLLIDTGKEAMGALDEEEADYTARELEAKLIAARMRELADPEGGLRVWDKEKGQYRAAGYGDMVILLRSMDGWSDTFLQVLTQEGIPAYAETGTGYFNTIEVETVLAMLAVIDNPIQDIPLAAVLRSPMAGLTDEELAWMTAWYKKDTKHREDRGIYGAFRYLLEQAEDGENDAAKAGIADKLSRFSRLLSDLRARAAYLPIHELIYRVYEQTGYYDYVSAMPAGETRSANLDMLIEKASAFEKTSYKGLFQFIRYITQLKKYETDFGEASAGQYENMARVMSIHKSKGLEFPIVFLAGMGKQFNKQDVRGRLLIDADLGIGTDYLDLERRVRTVTLKKQVLKRKMELDSLGEELRVFYVAATRAREKLIMTGTDRSLAKKLERWQHVLWGSASGGSGGDGRPAQIPYTVLSTAASCLDWVLMSQPWADTFMDMRQIPAETLVGEEVARRIRKQAGKEELLRLAETPDGSDGLSEYLDRCFLCRYTHEADVGLCTKMTVSELKKLGQELDDFDGPIQAAKPSYLDGKAGSRGANPLETGAYGTDPLETGAHGAAPLETGAHGADPLERGANGADRLETGAHGAEEAAAGISDEDVRSLIRRAAQRGTAYHRVLELLDFTKADTWEETDEQIRSLAEKRRISRETADLVRTEVIWRFAASALGRRMGAAQKAERLHREQQFVMGIPAREMGLGDSDELVLIQGIIDAYLEEDDGLVLLDYKTDRVKAGEEEMLTRRYGVQLDYYQRALEQITKKKVKERYIYSLSLQKAVRVGPAPGAD